MIHESPFLLIKKIETELRSRLSFIDTADLNPNEQQRLSDFRNGLIDARLDVQDYELAETRDNQLKNAKDAIERLRRLEAFVVEDKLNVFSATDVAQLSAQIEHIAARLK